MAETIGGAPRNPGDPGHEFDQIMTPMCKENVGRKNTPGVHSYKGVFHDGSEGSKGHDGMGTSNSIEGPGKKGEYPIEMPKETKLTR
jgi:hypothetical protein